MNPNQPIFEAIALRKCIEATYNKMTVLLAPHVLYTRHDELFVDAVTIEREGRPPREIKLGTFKLAGLQIAGVTDRRFERFEGFDPAEEKYRGVTLFAIDG